MLYSVCTLKVCLLNATAGRNGEEIMSGERDLLYHNCTTTASFSTCVFSVLCSFLLLHLKYNVKETILITFLNTIYLLMFLYCIVLSVVLIIKQI